MTVAYITQLICSDPFTLFKVFFCFFGRQISALEIFLVIFLKHVQAICTISLLNTKTIFFTAI